MKITWKISSMHRMGVILSLLWIVAAGFHQRGIDVDRASSYSSLIALQGDACINETTRQVIIPYRKECMEMMNIATKNWMADSFSHIMQATLLPLPVIWIFLYLFSILSCWVKTGKAK